VEERRAATAAHLPSLVVCPSTLVLHWAHEVAKFVADGALRTLAYQGAPQVRPSLQLCCHVRDQPRIVALQMTRAQ
jgi:TATA-binding protein-associated factor